MFWNKKPKTYKNVDVKKGVATVTMLDQQTYTITRLGYIFGQWTEFEYTLLGDNLLRSYFRDANAFVITDDGKPLPTAQIKCVSIEAQEYLIKVEE